MDPITIDTVSGRKGCLRKQIIVEIGEREREVEDEEHEKRRSSLELEEGLGGMGFWMTTMVFFLLGLVASASVRLCCNRGPSTNLYILIL